MSNFLDLLKKYNFYSLDNKDTRIQDRPFSSIDHMFFSRTISLKGQIYSAIFDTLITDHKAIMVQVLKYEERINTEHFSRHVNYNLKRGIGNFDWNDYYKIDGIDQKTNHHQVITRNRRY